MKKNNQPKLFEYRIQYNAGSEHSAIDSYHYYMAENASQAFHFHIEAIKHKKTSVQNICLEKFNPYSEKWEDKTEFIEEVESNYQT
jgi:hypothetical protein